MKKIISKLDMPILELNNQGIYNGNTTINYTIEFKNGKNIKESI